MVDGIVAWDAVACALLSVCHRAWRADEPPVDVAEDVLAVAAAPLLRSGLAGLAFVRVPRAKERRDLRDAHRVQVVRSVAWAERTGRVASTLREARVDAVFAKGWTLARRYPRPESRTYGDIDVLVAPRECERAALALERAGLSRDVDLHVAWDGLEHAPFASLFTEARVATAAGAEVRFLAPEAELRYLCVHYVKHGGARPLWLCDVGLVLEETSRSLDWERVVRGSARGGRAVRAVVALAVALLGAEAGVVVDAVPAWLGEATRRAWLRGVSYPTYPIRLDRHLRRAVSERFPNALLATHVTGAPYDVLPRRPLQLAAFAWRAATLLLDRIRPGAHGPLDGLQGERSSRNDPPHEPSSR